MWWVVGYFTGFVATALGMTWWNIHEDYRGNYANWRKRCDLPEVLMLVGIPSFLWPLTLVVVLLAGSYLLLVDLVFSSPKEVEDEKA